MHRSLTWLRIALACLSAASIPALAAAQPVLTASTFLGGSGGEVFRDCIVAGDGSVILVGASDSDDFPTTPGAYQQWPAGGGDCIVVKLTADLSAVVFATYVGGSGWEKNTYGVDVDAQGDIYACGETRSSDFPTTPGAFQPTWGGGVGDGFVFKLSADGSTLLYASYLGGSDHDAARGGLDVVPDGTTYVCGWTESHDFPTTAGGYQPDFAGGNYDAFVCKISADGSTLVYSTFIGGTWGTNWTHAEYAVGIEASDLGRAYFVGSTTSADFPTTPGAFDRTHSGDGIADAYAACLSPDGASLVYSTFIGGGDNEWTEHQMALDAQGRVTITGVTSSADFPATPGAFQAALAGGDDAFVARFTPAGDELVYATYIGGSGDESAFGLVLNPDGSVDLAGPTTSPDFPVTPDAAQPDPAGDQDAHLARLAPDGASLDYATYLGGSGYDEGRFVAGDGNGMTFVTGLTESADFPVTPGAIQTSLRGAVDAYATRYDLGAATSAGDAAGGPGGGGAGSGGGGGGEAAIGRPGDLRLFPNPAGERALLSFDLPAPGPVTAQVFDVQGRLLATLRRPGLAAGRHVLRLGRRAIFGHGDHHPRGGVCFVRLQAAGAVQRAKLTWAE